MDNNLVLVRLLHIHGADINKTDSDSWTPLHAAAANGYHSIVSYLLSHGADPHKRTEEGETALDLVEEEDAVTVRVLQETKDEVEVARRLSVAHVVRQEKKEPAWVRRMSLQEAARKESVKEVEEVEEADTRRKGSAWVGKEDIPEEEEADEEEEEEEEEKTVSQSSSSSSSSDVKVEEEIQPSDNRTVPARQRRTGRLEQSNNVRLQFLTPTTPTTTLRTSTTTPRTTLSPTTTTTTTTTSPATPCIEKAIVLHEKKTNPKQLQSDLKKINKTVITPTTAPESKPQELKNTKKVGLLQPLRLSSASPAVVQAESKER